MNQSQAKCSRVLVKLSGEALLGRADYGIDADVLKRVAAERESQRMPDDLTADAARLGAPEVRPGMLRPIAK